ncbi:hypothetical protein F2P45_11515 [Massilia sp. CCM 8733]|uniref:Uncharacterized protein n=1 Tax=Massilia mucilaginosa TaxID=2609282 RepID=A0ABX0NS80_9BURK|nr:hypothetical protein [Massilia mucilaginosa]NHZ89636.1 hypothetical protein [Massilia mucilaginosa]
MITIEHLEVQFDVAGDDDEAVFARYFSRYINQWARADQQQKELKERLRKDQQLGDDGSYG